MEEVKDKKGKLGRESVQCTDQIRVHQQNEAFKDSLSSTVLSTSKGILVECVHQNKNCCMKS